MPGFANTKIVRSNRRTLSMQVLPDQSILVKAPNIISLTEINKFIEKNTFWIEKRLSELQKKGVPKKKQYHQGEEFLYLGESYSLKIGSFKEISLDGEFLLLPNFLSFRAEKEIKNWYLKKAKEVILTQLEFYSKQMGVSYKEVRFSDTRSKWGSCTHDNRLQFNWRLIFAPLLALNYVIVHELAHTVEKNHSRSFWSKVRLYNPSYRQQIKWFKQNGERLFNELV